MARPCSICTRDDRDRVDAALVMGGSYRAVASRFGLSKDSVRRHSDGHLSPTIAAVTTEREHRRAEALTERIERLILRVEKVADDAESGGKVGPLLAAARELRGLLELLGKATGELKPDGVNVAVLNITESSEWLAVRGAVFRALAELPEARTRVASALESLPELEAVR